MHLPFLLNWYLNPYHTPLVVAKSLGFYEDLDIDLALIEPTNPTDVTKIIGRGEVKIGLKAMIHCFAARNRGYPIKSIGTLFDEPPTGFISLKKKPLKSIEDIVGKTIGYIGEFGKVMLDGLANDAGISTTKYTTKRVGMDSAKAILTGEVDAAIGLSCFQQVEVESQEKAYFLRIDKLADLGCCCFCSILFIVHESILTNNPQILKKFMIATLRGMHYTRENPDSAYELLIKTKPALNTKTYNDIFYRCLAFFSKQLINVERDWQKVACYSKKLKILDDNASYQDCYTNEFVSLSQSINIA